MNSLSFTRAERGMFYNEPSNFRNRKYLKLADGGNCEHYFELPH